MQKLLKEYGAMVLGSLIMSIATSVFLIPANIGIGGVTGVALCLNRLFSFKIGLVTILLNIPLFLYGFKLLGKSFSIKSGFVVFLSSITIDFLNAHFKFGNMNDMLLSAIFCGALYGVSMYIIFIYGGSSGGLDILAKIINNRLKSIQLSNLLLILDIVVYVLLAIVLGPRSVMYALIMSFVRSKTMDAIQEGVSSSRQCIIVCESADIIKEEIKTKLVRGVTIVNATGGYSNSEKKIIYVVIQKYQLNALKTIVKAIEPSAFVTVSAVNEIFGNYRNRFLSI